MADIKDFELPDLGEGLKEGEIVDWHVKVGDVVELNQTVADIETAKAVVAVPSPFAGRVVEKVGDVGETLEVGTVFLRIDVEGGAVAGDVDDADGTGERLRQDGQAAARSVEQTSGLFGEIKFAGSEVDDEPQPLVGYGHGKAGTRRRRRTRDGGVGREGQAEAPPAKPLAKPPVRKLAEDLGVDLDALAPRSGAGGVITREDVHTAASGEQPAAAGEKLVPGFRGRTPGEVESIRGIRKRIVEKMELSRREIPEATCSRTADLTELWELRKTLTEQVRKDGFEGKITPFALIMRAAVLGLRRFPTLNARIDRDAGEIHLLKHINLGIAADTERGLVVPNIKDAHTKSTLQLAMELAEPRGSDSGDRGDPGAALGRPGRVGGAPGRDPHAGLRPPHLRRRRGRPVRDLCRGPVRAAFTDPVAHLTAWPGLAPGAPRLRSMQ